MTTNNFALKAFRAIADALNHAGALSQEQVEFCSSLQEANRLFHENAMNSIIDGLPLPLMSWQHGYKYKRETLSYKTPNRLSINIDSNGLIKLVFRSSESLGEKFFRTNKVLEITFSEHGIEYLSLSKAHLHEGRRYDRLGLLARIDRAFDGFIFLCIKDYSSDYKKVLLDIIATNGENLVRQCAQCGNFADPNIVSETPACSEDCKTYPPNFEILHDGEVVKRRANKEVGEDAQYLAENYAYDLFTSESGTLPLEEQQEVVSFIVREIESGVETEFTIHRNIFDVFSN